MNVTSRLKRRLLVAVAALAAALLVLVVLYVAVMTVDVGNYRGQVEALLSHSLEREVRIGGAISLERSLNPRVVVDDITVANPTWASRPNLASIKQLQLRVALLPLLAQRLRIVEFKLVGADILIERSRDGTPNWLLGSGKGGTEESGMVAEVLSLGMERSKLAYRAPDGSRIEVRIADLAAKLAPGRPLRMQLSGRSEGVPIEVTLEGDTPEALLSPTQAWGFHGKATSGDFHVEVSGKVHDLRHLAGVDMELRYYGTRAGRLRSLLTRRIPKFAQYRGEVRFKSDTNGMNFEVNAEGSDAELNRLWRRANEESPLEISMGHLAIQGRGTAPTLRELLARSNWKVAAQDAKLRWQHAEGEPPTVIDRAKVTATVTAGRPIEIALQGRYRERAISARGSLGSIEALLAPKAAWRVDAEVESAGLGAKFGGALRKPLSQAVFEGEFDVRTDSLSDLGEMVGIELPPSRPARLRGKLVHDPGRLRFSDLQFALGGSRLQGNLVWSNKESPRLRVAVAPSEIRFEDLRGGTGPEPPRRAEPAETKDDKMIPAIPLVGQWMRDADVDLSLDDLQFVDAGRVLAAFSGQLRLANGRLVVTNLRSAVSSAPTVANMTIDASRDPATVEAELDAKSIDYGALLKASGVTDGVEGTLALHAHIAGQGNDLRALLRQATGRVEILGGPGHIRGRVIEVWAGVVLQILNPVSWAQGTDTELNCVAARFNISPGVARSELLLLDSRNVTVAGELALDLASERIRGLFKPQPKKASLIKLGAPLRLSGTLSHPEVAATDRTLITLGKLVVGIAQPAALIVLFGDLGAKEKNPCAALLAQQRANEAQSGSPANQR